MTLRRLSAGEDVGGEVTTHVETCDVCRATLDGFRNEQQQFEAEISFDRFAAGVERAARELSKPKRSRPAWTQVALALAAGLAIVVGAQLALSRIEPETPGNRIKGGAGVQVVVAGAGAQRDASEKPGVPEALTAGERVRVGITPDGWKYAIVVSIDEAGAITPVYLENGRSLALGASKDVTWLPESLEFTGAGLERLIVVLSASPLTLDQVAAPLQLAFSDARGDLTKLATLPLPGAQFHRTFLKP